MNTRRNFILITASALSLPLTGCTENGGDNGNETNGETDLGASVSVDERPREHTITVTLDEIGDAERVEVEFGGQVNLNATLYSNGDVAGLTNEEVIQEGDTEIDWDDTPSVAQEGLDIEITAFAVQGETRQQILDYSETLGERFVTATLSHGFSNEEIIVRLDDRKNSDYIYVVFDKDVAGIAKLSMEEDEVQFNAEGIQTINSAEDISSDIPEELRETLALPEVDVSMPGVDDIGSAESIEVVPPEGGDTVRIRGFAIREGRSPNIVIDDEGQV